MISTRAIKRWPARLCAIGLVVSPATAHPRSGETTVAVEHLSIHSAAIARNLQGNSANRQVAVLLPPGYERERKRRYPVVYFLPGFDSTVTEYVTEAAMVKGMSASVARGAAPAIIVVPDGGSRYGGSFYTSSPTTGDYERFVTRELVAEIDRRYRTIADRRARGISGHSMGGYGALRLAMRHPDVFSSVYALSSCCVKTYDPRIDRVQALAKADPSQLETLDRPHRMILASVSAWSPTPDRAPLHADLGLADNAFDPAVVARWSANSLNEMVPGHLPALRGMRGIAIDVGDKDGLAPHSRLLHEQLDRFGIKHRWTTFDGDHGNRLAARFESALLPFFAEHLAKQ